MAQVKSLPLTVSCSSKIQIGFTFLVPAYPGCPGKEAVKWLLLLLLLIVFRALSSCAFVQMLYLFLSFFEFILASLCSYHEFPYRLRVFACCKLDGHHTFIVAARV